MYQVSQISRPFTAETVRFLKISDSAMSIVAGRAGIPKSTTLPPCRTIRNASSIALSAPDISKTTPIPIPSFSPTNQAWTSSTSVTFTTASAPSVFASSSRKGTVSEASSRPAPNARAIAIEKSPTGPHPRTATARPASSWVDVANTAFPKGSCRHAISGGSFARSLRQTTEAGTAT